MKRFASIAFFLGLAISAPAVGAVRSVASFDPIAATDASLCGPLPLIPGDMDCSLYRRAGEPERPVTHFGETRLAFRVLWSSALYQTVLVRIEILSDTEAELHAYVMPTQTDDPPISVHTRLYPAEIRRVLREDDLYGIWKLAATRDYPVETPLPNGKVLTRFCSDSGGVVIEGFKNGVSHGIAREDCRFEDSDRAIPKFARALIRLAKAHFADIPNDFAGMGR